MVFEVEDGYGEAQCLIGLDLVDKKLYLFERCDGGERKEHRHQKYTFRALNVNDARVLKYT